MPIYMSNEIAKYPDESFIGGLRMASPSTEIGFVAVVAAGVYFGELGVGFPPATHFAEITDANANISQTKHKIVTLQEARQLLKPTDDVSAINTAIESQQSKLVSFTAHRETLGSSPVTAGEMLVMPALAGIAAGIWLGKKIRQTKSI